MPTKKKAGVFHRIKQWIAVHKAVPWLASIILSALLGWLICFLFPTKPVVAGNLPQKELSCVLNYSQHLMQGKSFDDRLQITFAGKSVDDPCLYSISIINSGDVVVTNEDFKSSFIIKLDGCDQILSAQVYKSSNAHIVDEILSNSSIENDELVITDFFLNPGEEFTVTVLTNGAPLSIKYDYRIAGISELVIRDAQKNKKKTIKEYRDSSRNVILLFMAIILLVVIIFVVFTIIENKRDKKRFELSGKPLGAVFLYQSH